MRYYDLTLADPKTGKIVRQWTSYPNGKADPAALNVEFILMVSVGATPMGGSSVMVEGVDLGDLSNANQFATMIEKGQPVGGTLLTLKGGMKAGLPLANPSQVGVLVQGQVFQSWGNWVSTDMALTFTVIPSLYTPDYPGNFVFNWLPGQTLKAALTDTFKTAYPSVKVTYNASANIVANRADIAFFSTFGSLAKHVNDLTIGALSKQYPGVSMVFQNGAITVFDGTASTPIALLQFSDFVGQPTWIDPLTVQVKTVLRGDISVGDFVEFPIGFQALPGFVQTTGAAYPSSFKYKSAIQGKFYVTAIQHIGNFRDPDGTSWASVFNCVAVPKNV